MNYSYNRLRKPLIDMKMRRTEMRKRTGIGTNILATRVRTSLSEWRALQRYVSHVTVRLTTLWKYPQIPQRRKERMAKNAGLSKAKDEKKDEFYTAYEDIQAEINHYEDTFKGKTILCNCDDPFESNFCKFFLRNFNYLGLKRLICTSYSTSPVVGRQRRLFDWMDEPVVQGNGYVMDIREVSMANGRGVSDEDIDALLKSKKRGVKKLKGDGDFRSEGCIAYLKQADIVVTNPPFSLFREYVAQLMAYQKSFLIIGNVNAITYKEIFPLIKDNKLWLGASIHSGDRKFYVPDEYPLRAAGCGVDKDGRKYIRVKGVRWFTNLDYATRHEELILYKKYYGNEGEYPKYDNYDAINVDKTSDIPCDYFEDMGVPITYLDKHNPEQFKIAGSSRDLGQPMSEIAPEGSYEKGGPRFYFAGAEVKRLYEDEDVQKTKGIYEFLLCRDTDALSAVNILNLKKWRATISSHGARADRQRRITVKCSAKLATGKRRISINALCHRRGRKQSIRLRPLQSRWNVTQ